MTYNVEIFGGAIRANAYLLALDALLLVHFVYSYYTTCYRKGFKVDYWHFNIFLGFVLPFLLIYPFAGSYLNSLATGGKINAISSFVDDAFIITVIGYVSTYAGFYYYNLSNGKGPLHWLVNSAADRLSKQLYGAVFHSVSLYVLAFLGLLLSITFFWVAIPEYGVTFDLRGDILGDPLMQPTFNLVLQSYVPTVNAFIFVRYLQYKEKSMLVLLTIFTAASVLSGSRITVISPFLTGTVLYLIAKQRKVSLVAYGTLAVLALAALFYLGDLRAGNASIIESVRNFGYNIAYGNNFSDIRDFAWIITYWDHEYIFGKSYLAAFLSFIPRSLSDFREVWSISVYTSSFVGLNPAEHAGLRPGKFGEPYLNFGMYGVVAIGFVGGYVLRYIDVRIKKAAYSGTNNIIGMYSYTALYTLFGQFYVTASFWSFYVFLFILVIGYLARQVLRPVSRKRKRVLVN